MSLFDVPSEDRLSEAFPEGEPFVLYEANYEGIKNTSFGSSHQASVVAGPCDKSSPPKSYKVFGRLAEQVQGVSIGELPTRVRIGQVGRGFAWQQVTEAEISPEVPF